MNRRVIISLFALSSATCGPPLEAEWVEEPISQAPGAAGSSRIPTERECRAALDAYGATYRFQDETRIPRPVLLVNPQDRVFLQRENEQGTSFLLTACTTAVGIAKAVALTRQRGVDITNVIHAGSFIPDDRYPETRVTTDHGNATAIDIRGVVRANRETYLVDTRWDTNVIQRFRSALYEAFETVLDRTNTSNHDDHFHASRALAAQIRVADQPCVINVTEPHNGQQIRIGEEVPIRYTLDGDCPGFCRIHLYGNNAMVWSLAAGEPCNKTYPFEPLPSMPVGDGYQIGIATTDERYWYLSNPFSIVASAAPEQPRANDETCGQPIAQQFIYPVEQRRIITDTPRGHNSDCDNDWNDTNKETGNGDRTAHFNWDIDCYHPDFDNDPKDEAPDRIFSMIEGDVQRDSRSGYGNRICVRNNELDLICCHNHLSLPFAVEQNVHVMAGQQIGTCGSTGISTGSHLDVYCTTTAGVNVNLPNPNDWNARNDLGGAGFHDDDPPQPDPEPQCRPSAERCDGVDNDCDGQVDENQMQTCVSACGLEGQQWCSNGVWGECVNANCAQEPDPRMTDADRDGWTADLDCDDHNPAINRHAREICNNGIDDNCDGRVDERLCDNPAPDPEPEPEPQPGNGTLEITVIYDRAIPALDFSYGYCSDIRDPAQCLHPWNQSVARENNTDRLTWRMEGARGGSIRFNSSFFLDGDNRPDSWLCVGQANPQLTARVTARLDGRDISNAVIAVPQNPGCSAGIVLPND